MKETLQLFRSVVCDLLAVLLFGWVIVRIRVLDSRFSIQLPSSAETPGVLMMIVGTILMCTGIAALAFWGQGTPSLLAPTRRLVASGPYRYVRNPIHIGQVILFAGLGFYLRSPAVLFFSFAWLLFCHSYVVLLEEGNLKKKFGTGFEEYCKAVPRWIPSVRSRKIVSIEKNPPSLE